MTRSHMPHAKAKTHFLQKHVTKLKNEGTMLKRPTSFNQRFTVYFVVVLLGKKLPGQFAWLTNAVRLPWFMTEQDEESLHRVSAQRGANRQYDDMEYV